MSNNLNKFEKDGTDNGKRAFKMLSILKENKSKYTKAKEIIEKLGLKPGSRVINSYLKILRNLGYEIESQAGFNGGYKLVDNKDLFFSSEELEIIENSNLSKKIINKIKKINERV